MPINQGMMTSNTDNRSTPQDLFDKLNSEFHFTLDPCATHENHKCDKYYTKEDDGLSKNWVKECVFCNPPYGREIGKRVEKAKESINFNDGMNIYWKIMLLPARTDTKRFHDYIYGKAEIRFIKGRLKFGGSKNSAPFPSMIVIFRSYSLLSFLK